MKKLLLLSAVMAGLSACGGSQDLKHVDYVKINMPAGGTFQADKKYVVQGRTHGNTSTDTQANPNSRDGIVIMDYVAYAMGTTPLGTVSTIRSDATPVAAPTSGSAYYTGTLLHTGVAGIASNNAAIRPYDISNGAIALEMDFANKKFTGFAKDVGVLVASTVTSAGSTTSSTTTTVPTLTNIAERTYQLTGDIKGTGYTGTATITETINASTAEQAAIYANAMGANLASGASTGTNVISGASVQGDFYGANAAETVGTISATNSKYNAIFGAKRSN